MRGRDAARPDPAAWRPRLRRRDALLLAAATGLGLAGCADDEPSPGSTLRETLRDRDGDGLLSGSGGEPLLDRTELGGGGAPVRTLVTFAQLTDVHVRDAQSPGRVAFLDRLGGPFGSTARPHETLTAHVLDAAVRAIRAEGADHVLLTGDLVDSAQANELDWALRVLAGRTTRPDSGARGYRGTQQAANPDPSYYRPDVDAPRHPGLLDRAVAPFDPVGLGDLPWWPVLGNHDALVQGELAPTDALRDVATGRRLLLSLDRDEVQRRLSGPLDAAAIDELLRQGLPGDAIEVSPDPRRAPLGAAQAIARLAAAAPRRPRLPDPARLDYAFAAADDVHVIALDLTRRDRGAGGVVTQATLDALVAGLDAAGDRLVVVLTHQPLTTAAGGEVALRVLDRDPRVVAVVSGHRHRHGVQARRRGGLWLVETASLVDAPQQWRVLRLVTTRRGLALETWVADHAGRPDDEGDLAGIARDLAWLDPQGGRPADASGTRRDRNVRLHLPGGRRRAPRPGSRPAAPPPPAPDALSLGDVPT